ncbi:hypothetical protein [Nocardia asiatica]|uniref:hypothetical protein n=1 Tax=Nocardia asiatica TaxID=209252 RepID=UPI0024538E21|nr:hypothetical protein [Nocardia asiatica]
MTNDQPEDDHGTHGNALLTLTTETSDGGRITQSWTICECSGTGIREGLGAPRQQSFATAEQVAVLARTALEQGGIHLGVEEDTTDGE